MPFTPYKASLDPETMQAAMEAFELAWTEIMARPNSQDAPACRDLLAKRIIDAALEHDERDPERLKGYALEGFNP